MAIPHAPTEGGGLKIHFSTGVDEGVLVASVFATAANTGELTEGERVFSIAVGGRKASGEAAEDGPVPIGGEYHASPTPKATGSVVTLLLDPVGRVTVDLPTTPSVANLVLVDADTEYVLGLPANCRILSFKCRTYHEVRYAWETGKVAGPTSPYLTLGAGIEYHVDHPVRMGVTSVYFASSVAGVVVEAEMWV